MNVKPRVRAGDCNAAPHGTCADHRHCERSVALLRSARQRGRARHRAFREECVDQRFCLSAPCRFHEECALSPAAVGKRHRGGSLERVDDGERSELDSDASVAPSLEPPGGARPVCLPAPRGPHAHGSWGATASCDDSACEGHGVGSHLARDHLVHKTGTLSGARVNWLP